MREYAGDVFEKIRSITTVREDFLSSWSRPAETAMSLSTGKSRAKFFFSKDKKYLVKTLNIQETRWLLKILPAYLEVSLNIIIFFCFLDNNSIFSI